MKASMLVHLGSICMLLCVQAASHNHGHSAIHLTTKKFSVYVQDTLNVTDVNLVTKPGPVTQTQAPFGSLFLSNDLVTEGPDPASARLGNLTAPFFACTPGSGTTLLSYLVLTLFNNSSPKSHELHGLHGTLTASGIFNLLDPQPQPVTGGTGSFAFVLGSATIVPIDVTTFVQVFRLDLILYWPPYSRAHF